VKWVISPLSKKYNYDEFDCTETRLNDYLKKYASQNQKKGYSITFVATSPNSDRVTGDVATIIEFKNIPRDIGKRLPKYPAPVMLIGQLAVDKTAQGKGLGKTLLIHALVRAVKISEEIGIFAVRVDAIDRTSSEFYLKYGFIPFQDAELSLFLPLKTIKNTLQIEEN